MGVTYHFLNSAIYIYLFVLGCKGPGRVSPGSQPLTQRTEIKSHTDLQLEQRNLFDSLYMEETWAYM